jgi:uncharacterized protein with HEPN domain
LFALGALERRLAELVGRPVDLLPEPIEGYLSGMDRNAFAGNGLVRDAIERCLERVCEAAHRLGDMLVS